MVIDGRQHARYSKWGELSSSSGQSCQEAPVNSVYRRERTDLERMSGVPPITVTGGRAAMCDVEVNSCPLLVLLTDPSTWDLREMVMQLMMEGGGQRETPLT